MPSWRQGPGPWARRLLRWRTGRARRSAHRRCPPADEEDAYVRGRPGRQHPARVPLQLARVHRLVRPAVPSCRCPRPPPPSPGYLTDLAWHGARVGTMSRRLSAIKFAPQAAEPARPDHGTPGSSRSGRASAAAPTAPRPSRPPRSCRPNCSTSSTPAPRRRLGAPAARRLNPDQAGARDRAPLRPVGLVAALRRSELAALTVADVTDHLNGLVLSLPPGPRPTRPANRPNSSSPPVRQPSPAGRPYILRSATSVSPSTWSSYARADRVPVLHAAIPRRRSVTQVPPRFESSTL